MAFLNYNKQKTSKIVSCFFYLLYLYLIVLFITSDPETGGGAFNQITAGLFVVFCSTVVIFKKKQISNKGKEIYYIVLVLFIFLIIRLALMMVSDLNAAMHYVRNEATILFWVVSLLYCIQEFKSKSLGIIYKFSKYLIFIAFIFFIYSIIIEYSYLQSINRIGAVNEAGSVYMLLPLIVIVFKGKPKIIAFLLCLMLCAWSQKRQALLGMGVSSLFLLMDIIKDYFKSFKILGIIIVVVSIIFSSVIFSNLFSGIIERQQYLNEKSDITDNGRSILWGTAIDGYLEAPLADKIIGGGASASGRYIESKTTIFMMPHNGFIEILCDYGLIGLICFLLFLFYILRLCFKFHRGSDYRKYTLTILMAFIVNNTFSHAGNIWAIFLCIALSIMCNNSTSHLTIFNSDEKNR